MDRFYFLFKKALTPITIMVIPHENLKSFNIRIPLIGILLSLLILVAGAVQTCRLMMNGLRYPAVMAKVDFYSKKFSEWNATVTALKQGERDFRRIFSLKSKENVLDATDPSYSGDFDIQDLMGEIQRNVERVDEIQTRPN